jgi:hypothetical protein
VTTLDSKKAARDARLDELKKAVDTWAESETKRLANEALFLKSVLRGRTGSGRLTTQGSEDTKKILVDAIGDLLEG